MRSLEYKGRHGPGWIIPQFDSRLGTTMEVIKTTRGGDKHRMMWQGVRRLHKTFSKPLVIALGYTEMIKDRILKNLFHFKLMYILPYWIV